MGGPNKPYREPAHGFQLKRSKDPAVLKAIKDGVISKSEHRSHNTTSLKAMIKRRTPVTKAVASKMSRVERAGQKVVAPKKKVVKKTVPKKSLGPAKKVVKKTVPKTAPTTGNARRTPSGVTGVSTRKSARGLKKGTEKTPK
tara:strand:- start:653 stop:1078 length:426 start_codon:yes stop_codon:yes gene_type:complete